MQNSKAPADAHGVGIGLVMNRDACGWHHVQFHSSQRDFTTPQKHVNFFADLVTALPRD